MFLILTLSLKEFISNIYNDLYPEYSFLFSVSIQNYNKLQKCPLLCIPVNNGGLFNWFLVYIYLEVDHIYIQNIKML